jgi:two-component system sensor histidine kinase SenX3
MASTVSGRDRNRVDQPLPSTPSTTPVNPTETSTVSSIPAPSTSASLVDVLPVAAVVVGPDDTVLLANQAARELGAVFDDEVAQAPGLKDIIRLARKEDRAVEDELALPVPTGFRFLPVGDKSVPVRVRASRVDVGGRVVLVFDDLTEARRVEAVRRDFVANVSHELKTPVGALSLLAEALADSEDDPKAVARFAQRIGTEAARLARLVQELIDLSRLEGADPVPSPQRVSLVDVVSEAVDRSKAAADANAIRISVVCPDTFEVSGDQRQLVTAVANLVENAIAYSPTGSRVTIGVARHGDFVELAVADEGIGIPSEEQERVFERFYRSDPARSRITGGTGLGLAIVKHVTQGHGGEVALWSAEGKGSTFTLRLPALLPATPSERK